ncbi:MAG TPA: phosphatidate cytidylyltransferase, partial [Gemmatimonadaceae bacterium]|nr:phosphatidate cytidylyltransferase [Gemmatimonadaceae bacterium]
ADRDSGPLAELGKRIAFSLVAIPVVLAIVWGGGLALALLLATAAGCSSWEFYRLAIGSGSEPLWGHGVLLSVAIPLLVYTRFATGWAPPVSVVMLVVLELLTVALWVRGATGKPLEVVGITILGAFYTGGMLAFGYALRYHRFAVEPTAGVLLVLLPLLLTWGTDTGAMLFGRRWGKTRLMPSVSPGKTVVGAWAGAIVSVVIAIAYVALVLRPYARLTMSLAAAAAFGLVVSAAGQVGDLVESMLKREANVKDSSNLIPGHGGALDRVDSLLFTLPVAFVLYDLLLLPTP